MSTATSSTPGKRRIDGILLLHKPRGLSSNAVLQRAKRLYRAQKAGHTGTLDPLASGLLPICFGDATKFAHTLLDADKTYVASIRLGATTSTGDAEGEVVATGQPPTSRSDIEAVLQGFLGCIAQVPPRYAALKRDGRKYYEYARAGVEITRHAREVAVRELELVSWQPPDLELRVRCGKGTYIRVLAEDIGAALGCGAHLTGLSRTGSGGFTLGEAFTLDDLQQRPEPDRDAALLPVDALVGGLSRLDLDESDAMRLTQGQALLRADVADGLARVYAAGCFVGVASVAGGVIRARRLVAQTATSASDIANSLES